MKRLREREIKIDRVRHIKKKEDKRKRRKSLRRNVVEWGSYGSGKERKKQET